MQRPIRGLKGSGSGDNRQQAMRVLESQLTHQNWFLSELKGEMLKHLRAKDPKATLSPADFPGILAKTGHDNLTHIAQFFFLLHALDCTREDQVEAFIKGHNEKVKHSISSGEEIMREAELKKVLFSAPKIAAVRETLTHFQAPVFAISEISALLYDLMSPRQTEKILKELLHCGLLRQRGVGSEDPPITTDPRRILVEPTEIFLDTYLESLLRTKEAIAG